MRHIDFYFGLGSRYSYLAAVQIAKIRKETGAEIVWKPVFSGRFFEGKPNNPFADKNLRGQYSSDYRLTDAQRWADFLNVPFKEPAIENVNWSPIIHACIAAQDMGKAEEFVLAVYDDIFGQSVIPESSIRLKEIADSVGINPSVFEQLSASPEIADLEEEYFNQAKEFGVFGVPTFVVGGALFWGQDRIPLLIHHLRQIDGQIA